MAMAGIGSMRVREEKRMVGIGLCERGKERLGEDGINEKERMRLCGF